MQATEEAQAQAPEATEVESARASWERRRDACAERIQEAVKRDGGGHEGICSCPPCQEWNALHQEPMPWDALPPIEAPDAQEAPAVEASAAAEPENVREGGGSPDVAVELASSKEVPAVPVRIPSIVAPSRSHLLAHAREIRAVSPVSFAQENSMRSMYRDVSDAYEVAQKKAEKAEEKAESLGDAARRLGRQLRTLEDMGLLHGIVLSAPPDYDTSDFTEVGHGQGQGDEDQGQDEADEESAGLEEEDEEPELPLGGEGSGWPNGEKPAEVAQAAEVQAAEVQAEPAEPEAPEEDPVKALFAQIRQSQVNQTCMYHPEAPAVEQIELATVGRPKVGACEPCWNEYSAAQKAKEPEPGTLFAHGKGRTDLVWKADPSSPTGMRWFPRDMTGAEIAARAAQAAMAEGASGAGASSAAAGQAGPQETPEGGPVESPASRPAELPADGPGEKPAAGPQETKAEKPARKAREKKTPPSPVVNSPAAPAAAEPQAPASSPAASSKARRPRVAQTAI